MCAMRWSRALVTSGVVAGTLGAAHLITAAPADADCVSTNGTTICSQGDVRGSSTGSGPGPTSGSGYGYMCGYDWDCDNGIIWDINLGGGIGNGGPGIGRPGGGGGGLGGGGGIGGR